MRSVKQNKCIATSLTVKQFDDVIVGKSFVDPRLLNVMVQLKKGRKYMSAATKKIG